VNIPPWSVGLGGAWTDTSAAVLLSRKAQSSRVKAVQAFTPCSPKMKLLDHFLVALVSFKYAIAMPEPTPAAVLTTNIITQFLGASALWSPLSASGQTSVINCMLLIVY